MNAKQIRNGILTGTQSLEVCLDQLVICATSTVIKMFKIICLKDVLNKILSFC